MSIFGKFMARLGYVRIAPYGLVLTPGGILSTRLESPDLLVGWIEGVNEGVHTGPNAGANPNSDGDDEQDWERIIARAHEALAHERRPSQATIPSIEPVDEADWEQVIARARAMTCQVVATPVVSKMSKTSTSASAFSSQDVTRAVPDMEQAARASGGWDGGEVTRVASREEIIRAAAPTLPPRPVVRTIARPPTGTPTRPQVRQLARGSEVNVPSSSGMGLFNDEMPTGVDCSLGIRRRQASAGTASE